MLRRVTLAIGTLLLPAGLAAMSSGCGPMLYTIDIIPASSAVQQAEQAGAAEWAPYEYWSAHEYLEKAAEEANEGNYQDAFVFAQRAKTMANEALERTRERRRAESGRAVEAATQADAASADAEPATSGGAGGP